MAARRLWPLLAGLLLLLIVLPSSGQAQNAEGRAEGLAPDAPSVLVINQQWPEWPETDDQIGSQVGALLRHFTPETRTIGDAEYEANLLSGYDRVVVIGNDPTDPLPSVLLEDLARTDRPILWLGYGVGWLQKEPAYGFHVEPLAREDAPEWVKYRGKRYPAALGDYKPLQVRTEGTAARVLATYGGGSSSVPYVVRGGNLLYVNGLPTINSEYPDPGVDGPPLIFADVLHEFFGTGVAESRKALVRLEDVSVHINSERIIEAADYLYGQHVPFSLGVIPAQRFEDGRVVSLSEKPKFVRALRYAQDRGGTIILHGYHHTFGTGEDYEYWDEVRDAPLKGETWENYAFKTQDGIRILRDQGLEPRFWETPHYAASPLAYRVFSRYFSHAVENRRTSGWMPYPTGPDEYGQILIPENLGYINPEKGFTVEAQLRRAETLGSVRDAWAVGFYHPASIPISELRSLVEGLREQGYAFADLRALDTEVRSGYRPSILARTATWPKVDLGLYMVAFDRDLERWSPWWPVARRVPWLTVLITSMMVAFLVRLPKQWRSTTTAASSLVESSGGNRSRGRALRPPIFLSAVLMILLAVGFWASSWGRDDEEAPDASEGGPLSGWSSLDWTVKYDGYGEVGVENGAAILSPKPAQRPVETHAALALAGDPRLRDYSFKTRMKFEKQLRQNSPPNTWETGWLFFRYGAEDRSYYLAHKTNGLELGKLVPPKGTGQVFLVTKPAPPAQPGRWYDYRIDVEGPTIRVYVDGKLRIAYTDPDPIPRGRVGLYTEDARVLFQNPTITRLP